MILTISYVTKHIFTQRWSTIKHTHPYYELIIYISGNGTSYINGTPYKFSPNTVCFIPPDTIHEKTLEEPFGEWLSIGFMCNDMPYDFPSPMIYVKDTSEIYHSADIIYREMRAQEPLYEKISIVHLENIITLLARQKITTVSDRNEELQKIYDYICQHFNQKMDFEAMALKAGFSYGHFRRLFKSSFDTSPHGLVIEQRFNAAKQMLENPEIPITNVAMNCGFSDSSQFSRMFKKKYNMSPGQYRELFLNPPLKREINLLK